MGVFEKLERRLDKSVNSAFARAFRSTVQPVEIASAIRGAMDDTASRTKRGQQPVVPNVFTVYLSTEDHAELTKDEKGLADELIAATAEHADTQRYAARGPWAVSFELDDTLETGVFRLRPSIAKDPSAMNEPNAPHEPQQTDEPFNVQPAGRVEPAAGPAGLGAAYAQWQPTHAPEQTFDERIEDQSPFNAPQYQEPDFNASTWQDQVDERDPYAAAPRQFQARPFLVILGERYELAGAITVLGRDDEADLIISDPGVSRRHSEIRVTNDGPHKVASVRDLGSTNGTFVNGDQITSARLRNGDRITIGRTSMTYGDGSRR